MKLKRIKYWFIASLCLFLVIPSEPTLAQAFLQPQWEYDITNGGKSSTSSHSMRKVIDATGNESLLINKAGKNNDYYIDSVDAKTGRLLWSMPTDNEYQISDDGYIFIFKNNKVSAKHIATGRVIWTATLPGAPEEWRRGGAEAASPGENGSLYLFWNSDDNKSSTLYYYNTKGKLSKKLKVPYFMYQIDGDMIVGSKFGDHPDLYLISLNTGKKIKTIAGSKGYNRIRRLSDGTFLHYNIYKNTMTLKGYNSTGQLNWTKQLPYKEYSTELYALEDRFLYVDVKNNRIKLYSSSGRMIAEKPYLRAGLINMALDAKSFMFPSVKDDKEELIIMDTNNLNILQVINSGELDLENESMYLHNKTGLYFINNKGRTLVSTQLSK
ncbi:PQQ-like domain-containing protein [Paenibacillus polysaccharolyticus]|uniref:PQQ-like domain-containing protein n=1 Tax=Paenibacillus polysaccharolyticus TaxID=582692 RepID=A0A1G5L7K4_9BACL|nr:PQQ-binding-like beta-propeller repeat protein [Paenibacillus polysaccharolyticus]SCZ08943.1 PQQ-like domain-containing protein [Paenibacillus polysaccharolyticus]